MPFDVEAVVGGNTRLSADYNVLTLAAPAIARAAGPGQFIMLKTAPGLDPLLRRPFSIFQIIRGASGDPTGLTVFNKRVGKGTAQLFSAQPGDRIAVLGPLGQPFVPVGPPSEAWLVAGGVGLAPFVTLGEALMARGTPTTLFYGGRRAHDLFCDDLFPKMGVRVILTTEDGSRGETGRVTGPLERALAAKPAAEDVMLYTCGPTPMMRAVADLGARFGRQVFVSLEPIMGCGMGGCYSCVVRVNDDGRRHFVRACIEGPVFDAGRVAWNELMPVTTPAPVVS
jgi:dihydroorotate dehydrogenase electron transfer subunit